ncbi:MAG: hypothetical protein GY714_18240 [Desulfobacterales bacterium]|nr:hypothetical protein [Desulfobacterales bacterium]
MHTAKDFLDKMIENRKIYEDESKNPLKKYARCKMLLFEMNLSNNAYDKIIQILIEELGI